ncbi:hypothetical protein [Campylobacter upsaliensis]|uniref:hypothetical protein n=1 Tax=Campylobacter upsaliensis TaxID=28080 RepID=UPI00214A06DB|nr:hypothetical protein [Campylobacter upsaliensis]
MFFLFLSYSALKAADEYCRYSYQEDRAIPLLLNYAIRLGVMGVTVANAPEVTTKYR